VGVTEEEEEGEAAFIGFWGYVSDWQATNCMVQSHLEKTTV
jgi:hypothetical protein